MSADSLVTAHVRFDGNKPVLEPVKPYRVRLMTAIPGVFEEELVWAHTYQINYGALQLIALKLKDVEIPATSTEKAEVVKAVITTSPRTFAPGTWRDVLEEVLPEPSKHSLTH